MHEFTDNQGKRYAIEITFGSLKAIRADVGLDLGKPFDGTPTNNLQRLADAETFVDVLYALLGKPGQASTFAARLVGEPFAEAERAFWSAYEDFFRSANRPSIADGIAKSVELQIAARELISETAAATDVEAEIEKARQSIRGLTSGNTGGNSRHAPETASPVSTI